MQLVKTATAERERQADITSGIAIGWKDNSETTVLFVSVQGYFQVFKHLIQHLLGCFFVGLYFFFSLTCCFEKRKLDCLYFRKSSSHKNFGSARMVSSQYKNSFMFQSVPDLKRTFVPWAWKSSVLFKYCTNFFGPNQLLSRICLSYFSSRFN